MFITSMDGQEETTVPDLQADDKPQPTSRKDVVVPSRKEKDPAGRAGDGREAEEQELSAGGGVAGAVSLTSFVALAWPFSRQGPCEPCKGAEADTMGVGRGMPGACSPCWALFLWLESLLWP